MRGRALLAVPVTGASPSLETQVRGAVEAGAELVELRVDLIGDVDAVESLLRRTHDVPYILTVRSAAEGGAWDGPDDERVALIERLGLLNPGYVDVELATWKRSANLRQKIGLVCATGGTRAPTSRAKNRLILSHHDYESTPADIDRLVADLLAVPGAVGKAVFTPTDATDACRVMDALRRRVADRDLIALAMGEAGLLTRLLAPKFGGFLSFATAELSGASAPGQPSVADLRELYRWDAINERTAVFGVVGWPVAHSLSPHIHNAAMEADDIDGVYLPLPVAPSYESFATFMDYLATSPWLDIRGLSVTLPHKPHALRWLDSIGGAVSSHARECGVVNTLTRGADGDWSGDNTDTVGVLAALATLPGCAASELAGRSVDVLGAGGVARAVIVAMRQHGASVTVYNRTPEKARALANDLGCAWRSWDERRDYAGEILINCTSLGLSPASDSTPMPDEFLRAETAVFDTVYAPGGTHFLLIARSRGCRAVGGGEMLVGQAVRQYAIWHGRMASTAVMSATVAQHLR